MFEALCQSEADVIMKTQDSIRPGSTPHGQERFATTHWSVVRAAGRPDSVHYQQALETLCKTYLFPLYAYLRRHGNDSNRAEEYTQAFFAHLPEKDSVRAAVHRLRRRYREVLRDEIAQTVSSEEEIDQEIRDLFTALAH